MSKHLNVADTLAALGIEEGRHLGSGAFANVFSIKGDTTKVVKITHDPRDANLAMRAKLAQDDGKLDGNLARVYEVFRTEPNPYSYGETFVEIVERLHDIPDKAYNHLPNYSEDFTPPQKNGQYPDDFMIACHSWTKGQELPVHRFNQRVNVWSVAALNAAGIYKDLKKIGCKEWFDFKLKNVLMRWQPNDKRIVLSDYGCTDSPKTFIPYYTGK